MFLRLHPLRLAFEAFPGASSLGQSPGWFSLPFSANSRMSFVSGYLAELGASPVGWVVLVAWPHCAL